MLLKPCNVIVILQSLPIGVPLNFTHTVFSWLWVTTAICNHSPERLRYWLLSVRRDLGSLNCVWVKHSRQVMRGWWWTLFMLVYRSMFERLAEYVKCCSSAVLYCDHKVSNFVKTEEKLCCSINAHCVLNPGPLLSVLWSTSCRNSRGRAITILLKRNKIRIWRLEVTALSVRRPWFVSHFGAQCVCVTLFSLSIFASVCLGNKKVLEDNLASFKVWPFTVLTWHIDMILTQSFDCQKVTSWEQLWKNINNTLS